MEISAKYNPEGIEQRWYNEWMEQKLFSSIPALKDFVIAYYQKQGELTQVLPLNQTNGKTPISFP